MNHTLFIIIFFLTGLSNAQTVTIGTQVWMTKNLDVATFRNGDPIPEAKTNEEWKKAGENKQPAWCYYNNDPANGAKYGKLYNWYAVNDPRGLAPIGYHIPSVVEWTIIVEYLGGEEAAGKKMKSTTEWLNYTTDGLQTCLNCKNWNQEYRSKVPCHVCKDTRKVNVPKVTTTGNGSNSSGFLGLPCGERSGIYGTFHEKGNATSFWGNNEEDKEYAICLTLVHGSNTAWVHIDNKGNGQAIRCIKD